MCICLKKVCIQTKRDQTNKKLITKTKQQQENKTSLYKCTTCRAPLRNRTTTKLDVTRLDYSN